MPLRNLQPSKSSKDIYIYITLKTLCICVIEKGKT